MGSFLYFFCRACSISLSTFIHPHLGRGVWRCTATAEVMSGQTGPITASSLELCYQPRVATPLHTWTTQLARAHGSWRPLLETHSKRTPILFLPHADAEAHEDSMRTTIARLPVINLSTTYVFVTPSVVCSSVYQHCSPCGGFYFMTTRKIRNQKS